MFIVKYRVLNSGWKFFFYFFFFFFLVLLLGFGGIFTTFEIFFSWKKRVMRWWIFNFDFFFLFEIHPNISRKMFIVKYRVLNSGWKFFFFFFFFFGRRSNMRRCFFFFLVLLINSSYDGSKSSFFLLLLQQRKRE